MPVKNSVKIIPHNQKQEDLKLGENTTNGSEMKVTDLLELSEKDFIKAIVKMLQLAITNMLENNRKKSQ